MRPIAWKLLASVASALALAIAAGCNVTAGNGATGCQTLATCGGGGATSLTECVTNDTQGVCIGKTYKVGAQSFDCHSCIDCADAQAQASQACAAVPSGSGSGGSSGSSSGSSSGGNGTCSAKTACGTSGVTYQECTKTAANGACESIVYETSDGQSFACAGCSNCQAAASQLAQYCANPGGKPATTCTSAIACGSGGLSYQQCTTTANGACESIQYRVSNGAVYTCASCGDCTAADQQLTNYCSSQGNPTTSCSTSTSCGSSGLTYSLCTTYAPNGTCESSTYEVSNGASYTCAGCGNCASAYDSLSSYCGSQGPTTSCSSTYACGSGGATYSYCETTAGGACQSIAYETSTGYSWQCNTCSDCTSAYDNVTSYCNGLSGSSSGGATCGSTTCGSAASCCYCSGTYECITIPSGSTCADYGCTG